MKEAEITCTASHVRIKDLGLDMQKGDIKVVSEDAARRSEDLEVYRKLGGVRVRYVRRCETVRPIPPIALPVPPGPPTTPTPPPAPLYATEDDIRALERQMVKGLRDLEIRLKAKAQDRKNCILEKLNKRIAELEKALEEVVASKPPKPPKPLKSHHK